jgi:hypothetical protein
VGFLSKSGLISTKPGGGGANYGDDANYQGQSNVPDHQDIK